MSLSTDGHLSYGIIFDESTKFPWGSEDNIHEWWKKVNNYVNPYYCPYTEQGAYKDDAPVIFTKDGQKRLDFDDPKVTTYYNHWREWSKANPIPVQLVNYCSDDSPMYLIAVKHVFCSRGYPVEIDPSFLEVSKEEKRKLQEFLDRFGIEADEPRWWLTSYMG